MMIAARSQISENHRKPVHMNLPSQLHIQIMCVDLCVLFKAMESRQIWA